MTVRMNWIGNMVASFHPASAGGCAKTGLLRSQSEGTGFVGHSRIGPVAKPATLRKTGGRFGWSLFEKNQYSASTGLPDLRGREGRQGFTTVDAL